MRRHLNDREMAACLEGAVANEVLAHLASCPACGGEARRLRASLAGLAEQLQGEAERPDAFFQAQHARIAGRLSERAIRPWYGRWAWMPALAAAALLAGLLMRGRPLPEPPVDAETDQAFLQIVQRSIDAEMPGALRPAALLVAEVERSLSARE